jgi:hypothetical protein
MSELAHCHVAFRLDIRSGHFLHRSLFLIGVDERKKKHCHVAFCLDLRGVHFYTVVVSNMAVACMQADLGPFPKQASKPKTAQPTTPPCYI